MLNNFVVSILFSLFLLLFLPLYGRTGKAVPDEYSDYFNSAMEQLEKKIISR